MSKSSRNVAVKTLTLGTPETILLPRNYNIRNIVLRLTGTINVATGTTAMTQLRQGAANILSNLRVRRDGKDTLFAMDGKALWELNRVMYGKAPSTTLVAVSATATNQTLAVNLIIPFENVGGVKEFDTLLSTRNLSSLDLLVDTQAAQNIVYGGNGTITVNTAFTLEVNVNEEILPSQNFIFGDIRHYLAQKVSITGASSNFQIKPLPVGNSYKGLMLVFEDTGVPSDSLCTNVKVKSGTEIFVDRPYQALQNEVGDKKNMGTIGTGIIYIDLMPDGSLNQTLDLTQDSGRQTCELELVTAAPSGTAYCSVYVLEYIAPVIANKK